MALISCQALLESPEPKDPQDGEVARMMREHPEQYLQKARQWAVQYAGAPDEPMDMTPFLESMGLTKKEDVDPYVQSGHFTNLSGSLLTIIPGTKDTRS